MKHFFSITFETNQNLNETWFIDYDATHQEDNMSKTNHKTCEWNVEFNSLNFLNVLSNDFEVTNLRKFLPKTIKCILNLQF
jgi:hypothetical protein